MLLRIAVAAGSLVLLAGCAQMKATLAKARGDESAMALCQPSCYDPEKAQSQGSYTNYAEACGVRKGFELYCEQNNRGALALNVGHFRIEQANKAKALGNRKLCEDEAFAGVAAIRAILKARTIYQEAESGYADDVYITKYDGELNDSQFVAKAREYLAATKALHAECGGTALDTNELERQIFFTNARDVPDNWPSALAEVSPADVTALRVESEKGVCLDNKWQQLVVIATLTNGQELSTASKDKSSYLNPLDLAWSPVAHGELSTTHANYKPPLDPRPLLTEGLHFKVKMKGGDVESTDTPVKLDFSCETTAYFHGPHGEGGVTVGGGNDPGGSATSGKDADPVEVTAGVVKGPGGKELALVRVYRGKDRRTQWAIFDPTVARVVVNATGGAGGYGGNGTSGGNGGDGGTGAAVTFRYDLAKPVLKDAVYIDNAGGNAGRAGSGTIVGGISGRAGRAGPPPVVKAESAKKLNLSLK